MSKNVKNYVKGNELLKSPNYKEYISRKEFKRRTKEIAKCRNNPIYFAEHYYTIVSLEKGKHIVKLYSKQKELIKSMVKEDRIVVLASRQVGKTTAYNIFALWLTLFHRDKAVLICANTGDSATDFVSRIRMAYEMIPMWLKPGVFEWNKRRIKFANGCQIEASATSPAVRGKSCNVLILDEFAFVDKGIEKEFWEGVYPVVSSAKGTKVIMVSTPNGTGNIYYQTWDRATMGIGNDGWVPIRIDWFEVPGRDENWKKKQISSLNGDMRAWAQEFGNKFFGSAQTLVEGKYIREFKEVIYKLNERGYKPVVKNFGNGDSIYDIKLFEAPDPKKTYLVGADAGEGIGGDSSTILVFDISNTAVIRLVASYGENQIGIKEFSYLLAKTAVMYNNAFIAIENNGITKGVIDDLFHVYEYDNLVSIGKMGSVGIRSTHQVKVEACLWLKSLIQIPNVRIILKEPRLVAEMEVFERKIGNRSIFKAAGKKHDDFMMAFIWAMFVINSVNVEDYYDVTKWLKTEYGTSIPQRIVNNNYSGSYTESMIDTKYQLTSNFLVDEPHYQDPSSEARIIGFMGDEDYDEYGYDEF